MVADVTTLLGNGTFASGSGIGFDTTNAGGTFTAPAVAPTPAVAALNLTKLGTGTLVLPGTNGLGTGSTTILNGSVNVTSGVNNSLGTGALVLGTSNSANLGNLDLGSTSQTVSTITVPTSSATANTITIGAGQTLTATGAVNIGLDNAGSPQTRLTVTGATATFSIGTAGTPTNANVSLGLNATTAVSNGVTVDLSGVGTFFANLDQAIERFGPTKVSALPTIDIDRPPGFDELIDNFAHRGLRSIYLRPINHQGFARRGRALDAGLDRWNAWHAAFIERLIQRNFQTGIILEEYYFSQCLKRVLRAGTDEHVDLRNPSFVASDYIVIDHDGVLYPTDEARMQSRISRIDLSVGHVGLGLDVEKVATLNAASCNNFDPDCIHCPYQPFCGSDIVDDISRYGRIDLPRPATWFCRRHLSLFDKVFELLYRRDEATRLSLSRWAGIECWPESLTRELA